MEHLIIYNNINYYFKIIEVFDENHKYRYKKIIRFNNFEPGKLTINVILLNPSPNDEGTIKYTVEIIVKNILNNYKNKDIGEIVITNLLPIIDKNPTNLKMLTLSDQIIKNNFTTLSDEIIFNDILILAFGEFKNYKIKSINYIKQIIINYSLSDVYCWNINLDGSPTHPARGNVNYNTKLQKYNIININKIY